MSSSTLGFIGLAVLIVGTIVMLAFSIRMMSGESRQTAEINRRNNNPVSNGYANVAIIAVSVVFILVLVLGLLPPLLRRG